MPPFYSDEERKKAIARAKEVGVVRTAEEAKLHPATIYRWLDALKGKEKRGSASKQECPVRRSQGPQLRLPNPEGLFGKDGLSSEGSDYEAAIEAAIKGNFSAGELHRSLYALGYQGPFPGQKDTAAWLKKQRVWRGFKAAASRHKAAQQVQQVQQVQPPVETGPTPLSPLVITDFGRAFFLRQRTSAMWYFTVEVEGAGRQTIETDQVTVERLVKALEQRKVNLWPKDLIEGLMKPDSSPSTHHPPRPSVDSTPKEEEGQESSEAEDPKED